MSLLVPCHICDKLPTLANQTNQSTLLKISSQYKNSQAHYEHAVECWQESHAHILGGAQLDSCLSLFLGDASYLSVSSSVD